MMLRMPLFILAAAGLVACAPSVPDSARGVGFDTYEAQAQRNAALANPIYVPDTFLPPDRIPGDTSAEATAAETRRILDATRPSTLAAPAPVQNTPVPAASLQPIATNNAGISDENDFDAVAQRQTIESDAARIAQNRAQYQVVQPEALPTRNNDGGPNIVQYALQTNHPRGQKIYSRSNFSGQGRFERNCARYASNDLAQIDFLARGGPENDRKGLDPDGDGYACGWDPRPFRNASNG